MHIPDGFLSLPVSFSSMAVTVAFGFVAHKKMKFQFEKAESNLAPLMGCSAGFIFAAQMLNFPVLSGTSGHFLGAAFATALFGPWAAFFILSSVLLIQALFFADGGLLALGVNVLLMGIVAPWSYFFVSKFTKTLLKNQKVAILLGSWASVFATSIVCSLLLALSDTVPFNAIVIAMGGVHALIGIGEGLITASAVLFVAKSNICQFVET